MKGDLLEQLRADYARFPADQSYDLYAEDVYFQDPLNRFRGVDRYRQTIQFIERWFEDVQLDLFRLESTAPDCIETQWRLSWTAPLPWKPRLSIPGRSELRLNAAGKVCSHIDYWDCSRWDVVKQLFQS